MYLQQREKIRPCCNEPLVLDSGEGSCCRHFGLPVWSKCWFQLNLAIYRKFKGFWGDLGLIIRWTKAPESRCGDTVIRHLDLQHSHLHLNKNQSSLSPSDILRIMWYPDIWGAPGHHARLKLSSDTSTPRLRLLPVQTEGSSSNAALEEKFELLSCWLEYLTNRSMRTLEDNSNGIWILAPIMIPMFGQT